ncbi:MAG: hypothetical protein JWL69_229 [Phycisphaerales bacterium]|jgi:hypothetical protein|nr:hypothetical protein [Phycisphaerales bacterium]
MFKDINESIVYCLKAAVDAGEGDVAPTFGQYGLSGSAKSPPS